MNTLNFLDTNVWLALVWNRHIHSDKANRWFEENATAQFFYCRFTQMAILGLLTTDGVMGKDVVSMSGAWDRWDEISADTRISLLPEPENI
jgi:predicted nucleic acid-binding protein